MSMRAEDRYDSLFQFYGSAERVDWHLLKAQAIVESGLNPDAQSPVGAKGLAQFLDAVWAEWRDGTPGIQTPPPANLVHLDPRDPEDAIRAQAAYMRWLLDRFDSHLPSALAAYNWGPGRVRRAVNQYGQDRFLDAAPAETRTYVARVLLWWERLREAREEDTT